MKIVIGTSNRGKIREIAAVLAPLGYSLEPQTEHIAQIGETNEDNAKIKYQE